MKKLLALVLALVMTLSLCTVSNAAYTDAADIDYAEAVDVMSAIGVLQGSDGKFNPDGILTRAEACTIIAKLLGMGSYVGKSNFADCQGHWGEGAIALCAGEGIVDGVGGGKFDPNGKLTGYAFAKMLLVALGYDAKIEGMTGSDWTIKVAKLIKSNGLDDGIKGFVGSAEVSREVAAQMGFNALDAAEVTYSQSQSVTNKGEITTSTSLQATAVLEGVGNTLLLREDYFSKLKDTKTYTADGTPATQWYNGASKIGTYAWTNPVATYTAKLGTAAAQLATLKTELGGYTFSATSLKNTNGYKNGSVGTIETLSGLLEDGTIVKVFADKDSKITDVTVINTYLAKVTAKDTANKKVTLTIFVNAAEVASTTLTGKADDVNKDFYDEVYAMTKGDYVLVNVATANGAPAAGFELAALLGAPETVTGIYTSQNVTAGTYTIAGAAYKLASKCYTTTTVGNPDAAEYDLKLDQFGNVIYMASADVTAFNYAYVLGKSVTGDPMNGFTYYAKLLLTDGTEKWVTIGSIDGKSTADALATKYGALAAHDFVTYVKGDTYALSNATGAQDGDNGTKAMTKGSTSFAGKTVTNKTVVLVYNASTEKYTAYTGLKNIPTLATTESYTLDTDGTNDVARIVVVEASSSTAKDVVYIYNATATAANQVNGSLVKTYKAIVDGVITTIDTDESVSVKAYVGNTYSDDGYIDTLSGSAFTASCNKDLASAGAEMSDDITQPTVWQITTNGDDETIVNTNGALTIGAGTNKATGIVDTEFECYEIYNDAGANAVRTVDISAAKTVGNDRVITVVTDADGFIQYVIIAKTAG